MWRRRPPFQLPWRWTGGSRQSSHQQIHGPVPAPIIFQLLDHDGQQRGGRQFAQQNSLWQHNNGSCCRRRPRKISSQRQRRYILSSPWRAWYWSRLWPDGWVVAGGYTWNTQASPWWNVTQVTFSFANFKKTKNQGLVAAWLWLPSLAKKQT